MLATRFPLQPASIALRNGYLGSSSHSLPLFRRSLATTAVTYEKAKSFEIPLIDFSRFQQSHSLEERLEVSKEVVQGFKDAGFIYLSNHSLAPSEVATAFEYSQRFFDLPMKNKLRLAWRDPKANRGYVAQGRERVTQSTSAEEIAEMRKVTPDFKESMEIGREDDEIYRNYWPEEEEVEGFRREMLKFFNRGHELHVDVMRSIALGLGLQENWFDSKVDGKGHNLRLLNYPPVPVEVLLKGGNRAGAHSDYGTITLLFQDEVGGLEVQNPHTGEYVPATPIPDTIVVNAGDLLARWSNNLLRSTLHRVVAPRKIIPGRDMTAQRKSIAFFCNPNFQQEIACIPTCAGEDGPQYKPISTENYIVSRLKDTYT